MDQIINSMSKSPIMVTIISTALIVGILILVYNYLKGKSFDAIREDVYQLFVKLNIYITIVVPEKKR